MGPVELTRVFDPLDLEIIDRVYEAAWARLEARDSTRDRQKDGERQEALKQRIFALAGCGHVDFDSLCDKVLANLPPERAVPAPKPLGNLEGDAREA
jgi:hypothetical protein